MLPTLVLASTMLFTGGAQYNGGGPGPISSNSEWLTSPRVGISSREDVIRMWGKPASEKAEKDHVICTWPRGRPTVILTFNTRLDCVVDRKVVKNQAR